MHAWHLTLATDGRLPMAPTEAERRALVAALLRVAGPHLALFCVVDDHVHLVVLGDRARAGRVARAVLLALRPLSRAALDPARVRPVESRSHADWLARRYVLAQPAHHVLPDHPALCSGSCFQELVGARAGPPLRVLELLPRFRLRDILPTVGLPAEPIEPLPVDALRARGPARLLRAAAAAACAPPELAGRAAAVVAARRAAAWLAQDAGIVRAETAHALGLGARGLRKLLSRPADPALLRATRVRLALEDAVRAAP